MDAKDSAPKRGVANDTRFAQVHTDPRFRTLRRKKRQKPLTTDTRFAETDPDFQDRPSGFDKYGRQTGVTNPAEAEADVTDPKGVLLLQRMRGMCPSDSDSESSDDSAPEAEDQIEWGAGFWAANPDEAVSETEATRRLALVDMDWSKVTATDLLATFRSFAPENPASVERVTVYVSDYGMERLLKEEKQGPGALGLFGNKSARIEGDSDEEVAGEELRQYERSKLRYYYAVVDCSSVPVAERIVRELDGAEFETSQCTMDLRFVPDDETFEGRPTRDTAEAVPSDFTGPSFECNALQKTNMQLSWDDDDDRRLRVVRRRFTEAELQEQDFSAYMASDTESESDGNRADRYTALMEGLETAENPRKGGKTLQNNWSDGEDASSGPEAGLELGLIPDPPKKVKRDGQKIWKRYERRRAEKIKKQRRRGQFRVDSSASESDSGVSSAQEGSGKNPFVAEPEQELDFVVRLQESSDLMSAELPSEEDDPEQAERAAANVELLMMDDALLKEARKGCDVTATTTAQARPTKQKLGRRARLKQSIAKKKQKRGKAEEDLRDFKVDLEDVRFKALLDSSDFAIDPTDPAFRRTPGAESLLTKVKARHHQLL